LQQNRHNLSEDINKSNLKATVDRIINKNSNNNRGVILNKSQVDKINFCPNSHPKIEENEDIISDKKILMDSAQKKIKREMIPRLMRLELNAEQIAETLDLAIHEVIKTIS
jgi:hypothetical protein